ncbi:extracellular serine-rich protein [Diaporthe sp. PMI_573]|nr:extracellular serine-rich protein [Diaporthaceae sp. PMI_573]
MLRSAVFAILGATAIVFASPSITTASSPSKTAISTGVTHSVLAGLGGALAFYPENVVAEIGDVSSVTPPFFSVFFPVERGEASNVFRILVKDKSPIWYYCAQTTGNHCQRGMTGVINQDFDSPNTLTAYKAKAAETNSGVVPSGIQGGFIEYHHRTPRGV